MIICAAGDIHGATNRLKELPVHVPLTRGGQRTVNRPGAQGLEVHR
jgi:hypothetical protein